MPLVVHEGWLPVAPSPPHSAFYHRETGAVVAVTSNTGYKGYTVSYNVMYADNDGTAVVAGHIGSMREAVDRMHNFMSDHPDGGRP